VLQVLINASTRLGKVTLAGPMFSSLLIVNGTIASALFYGDFASFTAARIIGWMCGGVAILAGISALAYLAWTRERNGAAKGQEMPEDMPLDSAKKGSHSGYGT